MIITLYKRQLTYQQRKDMVEALLFYGLAYVQAVVRHFQCCTRTVWRIWSLYQNNGQDDTAILLKPRHSRHPNEHTQSEHDLIVQVLAEYPKTRYTKLYTILLSRGYSRSYKGMWGYIDKHNLRSKVKVEYTPRINKPYHTPVMFGFKWQMDVKYVEKYRIEGKAYQYTMIDECTRKCFEMAFREKSTYSTKTFIMYAIRYFGYKPLQIQTDNGTEFTNQLIAKHEQSKVNLVDDLLNKLHIEHKLIRPATPRHDGKVERRHREDEYEYQDKKFDDMTILNKHLYEWSKDKDETFTFALCPKCRKSPNMRHAELLEELKKFARTELKLNRKVKLQELIYAYAEYERIKQSRQLIPPPFIIRLPQGIELSQDVQIALSKI